MSTESLLGRWQNLRERREGISRGLIIESCACPFESGEWIPANLQAWEPQKNATAPSHFDILVLRDVDATALFDNGEKSEKTEAPALHLLRAATTAVRRGVPMLVHTKGRFAELKRPASSEVSPFNLDASRLLALEEFVYLLQVHCELPSPLIDPTATATYLTPIERKLSEALTAADIPFKVQVPIGGFVVDFLIDDKLVVECDGEAWHDPATDELRDSVLRGLDFRVVRFTGRAIHRDSGMCVERVKAARGSERVLLIESKIDMTDAQKHAASHIDGPAIVVAPAGSGKTRVIEERVRLLVAAGVEQSRICVLSFTNVAVGEVQDRLESFPEVTVRTLSKFANDIAKGHFGKQIIIENQRNPKIPTPVEVLRQVASSVGYEPDNRTGMWTTLRDAIGAYRGSFVIPDPDELGISLKSGETEKQSDFDKRRTQIFLDIHDAYHRQLKRKNLQDFNGQIIDAIQILSSNPLVRLEVSESYDYWLIDEFQDLSPPKIILARLLASPARNLMVVGDDDQIIYGFAGAQPQSFSILDRDWCDVTALPLDMNFRSPHELVVRTRWFIERNRQRIPKDTTPHRKLDQLDCVNLVLPQGQDYASAAVAEFKTLSKSRPTSDFVFLFRTSMAAAPVEFLLEIEKIPFVPLARKSILVNGTAQWVLAWLAVVNKKIALVAEWDLVLSRPNRYFSNATKSWIAQAADPFQRIQEAVRDGCRNVVGLSEKQKGNLSLQVDQFRELEKTILAARRFPDSLELQLRQLHLDETLHVEARKAELDQLAANAPVLGDGKSADPKTVYDIVSLMATLAGTWNSLEEFLEKAKSDPDIDLTLSEKDESPVDALRLKTIHQFKGRECPIVFVLGPQKGYMPDSRSKEPEALEEERRVAYVAATRAKERLYFWCSEIYQKEMSERVDGLTWDMYRSGLRNPPVVVAPKPSATSSSSPQGHPTPQPVNERQPGLLESALKWVMGFFK